MLASTVRSQTAPLLQCGAALLQVPSFAACAPGAAALLPSDGSACLMSSLTPARSTALRGPAAFVRASRSSLQPLDSSSRRPLQPAASGALLAAPPLAVPPSWWGAPPSSPSCADLVPQQHRAYTAGVASIPGLSKAYRERRLMPFSPKQLYDVVADVDHYHEFVPWCIHSQVTKVLSPTQFEADLEVGFQFFNVKYTSVVTTVAPQMVHSVAADTGVFNHLSNHWEISQGPTPTTTWLTFSVEFSFKSEIYRQAASLFFDQVQKKMICAFHDRCMQQYKKPAPR